LKTLAVEDRFPRFVRCGFSPALPFFLRLFAPLLTLLVQAFPKLFRKHLEPGVAFVHFKLLAVRVLRDPDHHHGGRDALGYTDEGLIEHPCQLRGGQRFARGGWGRNSWCRGEGDGQGECERDNATKGTFHS
jgi:hypothetical protein